MSSYQNANANAHPLSTLAAALAASIQPQPPSGVHLQQQGLPMIAHMLQNPYGFSYLTQQLLNQSSANSGTLPVVPDYIAQPRSMHSSSEVGEQRPRQATTLDTRAGSLVDDEAICVDALLSGRKQGLTTRQILESLHGVNNHTAGSWKDYYLEYQTRIDDKISERKLRVPSAETNSRLVSVSSRASSSLFEPIEPENSLRSSARLKGSHPSTSASPADTVVAKSAPSSKSYPQRRNNRSRSHKARPVTKTVSRSTARTSSHLRIPPPPSRSPTPPTVVAPADSTRNWFTVAEEQFFIKSIQWQLKQNPRTSMQTLASTLAEKVPSHPAQSWRWLLYRKHRHIVQRLIAMASDDAVTADDDENEGTVNESAEGKRYDASGPTDRSVLDNLIGSGDESEVHSDKAHQTDVERTAEELDIHDTSSHMAKMEEADYDDDQTLRPSPLPLREEYTHRTQTSPDSLCHTNRDEDQCKDEKEQIPDLEYLDWSPGEDEARHLHADELQDKTSTLVSLLKRKLHELDEVGPHGFPPSPHYHKRQNKGV